MLQRLGQSTELKTGFMIRAEAQVINPVFSSPSANRTNAIIRARASIDLLPQKAFDALLDRDKKFAAICQYPDDNFNERLSLQITG